MTTMSNTLTDVPGIRVGHATDPDALTGCTVILCPPETVGGVDQRGGAPGTRETDLLRPLHMVQHVHGVVLSGGSAFGLSVADGVLRHLEAQATGYPVGPYHVPIVPAAILMDLLIGDGTRRPDAEMGYAAAQVASDAPVPLGNVGAGAGCAVGTMMGPEKATKAGLGSASIDLGGGLIVSALVAVNAFGDVVGEDGAIIAGLRGEDGAFASTMQAILPLARMTEPPSSSNTVIGVVATNARLSKEDANKVAGMAQNGLAQAVRPAHTMFDGDTFFTLATGDIPANVNVIGAYAAEIMAQAIRNAVYKAVSAGGVRAWNDG